MGCHTWFHKKVHLTDQEVREMFISGLQKRIDLYQKWENQWEVKEERKRLRIDLNIKDSDILFYAIQKDYFTSLRDNAWNLPIYRIESLVFTLGDFDVDFKYNDDTVEYDEYTNTFYVDAGLHDLFRVGGYPSDVLYSYKDFEEFIAGRKEAITDEEKQKVAKFFDDFPDGFIDFG